MPITRKLSNNLVFIAFSDTHGDAEKLTRLYTLIEETIKHDRAANPKVKHILLIPGDVFSVNAVFSTISKGQFDIDVITAIANLFPENARFITPGNHDYFYEESQLIQLVKKAKLKVVITNTQFENNSQLIFDKIATLIIDDEKITLAGLMTPETLNNPGGKKVIKSTDSITLCPADLIKTPPDILISHLGSVSDKALPIKTIIVGGHSHDRQIDTTSKDKLVINTGAGECIAVIRGKDAKIIEAKDQKPSPQIDAIVKGYEVEYKINLETLRQTVFSIDAKSIKPAGLELTPEEISKTEGHLRVTDTVITRMTADGMIAGLKKLGKKLDFVLYPAAAIRSNFEPAQAVTGQQLFETYYYGNKLVEIALTGAELIALLTQGILSGYKCWTNRGQMLIPSAGLTYAYDVNQQNPGNTIRWAKVNGKFINPQEKFNVATTDWIASEVKKICPLAPQTVYADDVKIFKLVSAELNGLVLTEKFGERIAAAQTFQEQHALSLQVGNRRADIPPFDRYKIVINFAQHQVNYELENRPQAIAMNAKANDFGTKNHSGAVYLGSFTGLWAAKRKDTTQAMPDLCRHCEP